MNESENGKPYYTPAADYPGFRPPESHTLPSGAVFLLQKPQVMKMFRKGQIPNPLMRIVAEIFDERDQRDDAAEAEAKGLTLEELHEQRSIDGAPKEGDPPALPEITEEELRARLTPSDGFTYMDVIVWAAIVSPEVEMEPATVGPMTANGKLSYDMLTDKDIQYILHWTNEEVAPEDHARFPVELEREGGGADSRAVQHAPERAAGDPA